MSYEFPPKVLAKARYISKHSAQGNDFIIMQSETPEDGPSPTPDLLGITPDFVIKICDRESSIGADGFISLEYKYEEGPNIGDISFLLVNADGSGAELSGNGLRCVAQAVARRKKLQGGEFSIEVDIKVKEEDKQISSTKKATVYDPDIDKKISEVITQLGIPNVSPESKEDKVDALREKLIALLKSNLKEISFVDLGNPHLVLHLENLDDFQTDTDVESMGSQVMKVAVDIGLDELNIEFVKVNSSNEMEMKVFERGVGVTKACGTGAVASVAALKKAGEILKDSVDVITEGGTSIISVDEQGVYSLGGEVHFIELLHPKEV